MNGPIVVLLAVLAVIPLGLLILRLDAWLTERTYQREQRGDESRRYQRAREAVRRQQALDPSRTRIGYPDSQERSHD